MADRLISIDTAQAAGEQLPSAVRDELAPAIGAANPVDSATALAILTALGWVDNGDGTWSVG